jgi:hypothetical protein
LQVFWEPFEESSGKIWIGTRDSGIAECRPTHANNA